MRLANRPPAVGSGLSVCGRMAYNVQGVHTKSAAHKIWMRVFAHARLGHFLHIETRTDKTIRL